MKDHDDTEIHLSIRPNRDDHHHDQHLLRDVQAVNERITRALGPLPSGGLPVQSKRKPQLPRPVVPLTTPAPAPSDEDTPMQWKIAAAVTALATGSALAACGAGGETSTAVNRSPAAANEAPESVEMPPVKAVPQPAEDAETKRETAAEQAVSEPQLGPAIPAALLQRQILDLLRSFQTLEDLERRNVEKIFRVSLQRNPRMTEGYEYEATTTEGWNYSVSVDKLDRLDQPSTILIGLDHGVEPFTKQEPTYCTLEFEPIAKELVAMGYEQGVRAYNRGGKLTWGFGRDSLAERVGFGVGVIVYTVQPDVGAPRTCISGFDIGGGPAGE